jgi:hypothetical protein
MFGCFGETSTPLASNSLSKRHALKTNDLHTYARTNVATFCVRMEKLFHYKRKARFPNWGIWGF